MVEFNPDEIPKVWLGRSQEDLLKLIQGYYSKRVLWDIQYSEDTYDTERYFARLSLLSELNAPDFTVIDILCLIDIMKIEYFDYRSMINASMVMFGPGNEYRFYKPPVSWYPVMHRLFVERDIEHHFSPDFTLLPALLFPDDDVAKRMDTSRSTISRNEYPHPRRFRSRGLDLNRFSDIGNIRIHVPSGHGAEGVQCYYCLSAWPENLFQRGLLPYDIELRTHRKIFEDKEVLLRSVGLM